MPRKRRYILNISPQTNIRITQGDKIFFQIPEDKLKPSGLKRKRLIQRYNKYKLDLFEESRLKQFIMPETGAHVVFYIPVPRSWSKKKKLQHHMEPHRSKPDLDNLIKAMKDAIMREDKTIWEYKLTKRWINLPEGYIDISWSWEK